jgi:hypothetical protein
MRKAVGIHRTWYLRFLTQAIAPGHSTFAAAPSGMSTDRARPKRVLVMVIDAFKPRCVNRFDMANVKALRARGRTSLRNLRTGVQALLHQLRFGDGLRNRNDAEGLDLSVGRQPFRGLPFT